MVIMYIYGKETQQTITDFPMPSMIAGGWYLMQTERPTINHKAGADGVWFIVDAEIKDKHRQKIKEIRKSMLEKFTQNSGVLAVYDLNYEAATLGALDTVTVLRNGKTPAQHLGDYGSQIGMTASQFADYIIAENRGTTPNAAAAVKMSEIEKEYLRLYYTYYQTATTEEMEQAIADYQTFCNERLV